MKTLNMVIGNELSTLEITSQQDQDDTQVAMAEKAGRSQRRLERSEGLE